LAGKPTRKLKKESEIRNSIIVFGGEADTETKKGSEIGNSIIVLGGGEVT